jgi:hypothetical protein
MQNRRLILGYEFLKKEALIAYFKTIFYSFPTYAE